ncbi:secreted protein, CHAP domain [Renibacterium salmoninarum ATCC 33209]|uniref:Secreted protein, CHAP domain n=1 Tax=Renibacterium salmoninarum (strain ATCC 33209 / DSM 20767 / JCM 11484 / NBRC 15589 / NCIMB 2235) TaxID=288705 RepID=A9WP73_RENSM|nr:hypothetical protein [Renibacterium salmoninarum]ABY22848.1 secreted protein, CHAP domain [Renibacterium salmoninarum ATCC 33209]
MAGKVAGGVAVLAVAVPIGLVLSLVVFFGGAGAANADCTGPAVKVDAGTIPASMETPTGTYRHEQLLNAAAVLNAGAGHKPVLSLRGQEIGVMTALGESSLVNVDHGDAAGPDSVGLFQQRDSWGSRADRLDPFKAAGFFFDRLSKLEGWEAMEPSAAAHAVQRNADPGHYKRWWATAVQISEKLAD